MKYYIRALDTSGCVTLSRESVPAALKKASELISEGCLNVEIETPSGVVYQPPEFTQLVERISAYQPPIGAVANQPTP